MLCALRVSALGWAILFLGMSSQEGFGQAVPKLPILESDTWLLGRINLTAVDAEVLAKWLNDGLARSAAKPEEKAQVQALLAQGMRRLTEWRTAMIKEGANTIYFTFSDPVRREPIFYIPLAANGNVDVVGNLMILGTPANRPAGARPNMSPTAPIAFKLGDGVVVCAAPAATRLQNAQGGNAPHLIFYLGEAPAAPVQVVLAPSEPMTQSLETLTIQLPPPIDMPMKALTRGVSSAVLTVVPPPQIAVKLKIQSPDAASATALKTVIDRTVHSILLPQLQQTLPGIDAAALADALTPRIEGDQLSVSIDTPAAEKLASSVLTAIPGPLIRARGNAMAVQSAANIKVLGQAILLYANAHGGAYPDSLDILVQAQNLTVRNPRGSTDQPDFVYMKPAARINDVANKPNTVVFYENPDDLAPNVTNINFGFADGHVEALPRPQALVKIIELKAAAAK